MCLWAPPDWQARLLILHCLCFYSIWHSSTRRGRRQAISNYNSGSSRISGVLADGIDMSTGNAWLTWSPRYWLWFPGICLLGWLSLYTSWQCWATWSEWMEVWYPLLLKKVVRAGVLSYAPGSESEHVSLVSTLHGLVTFCWFVLVCWGGFVCFCVVLFDSLTNLCDRVINRWLV